jgi:hypothetical protein
MSDLVSTATKRNWDRMGVNETSTRLIKRANKLLSNKVILPAEYLKDLGNLQFIEQVIKLIEDLAATPNDALFTLCLNLFSASGIYQEGSTNKQNVENFKANYSDCKIVPELSSLVLPAGETDILGMIYQSLRLEGEKNRRGLYYTPKWVVDEMLGYLAIHESQTLLDPCCGSGSVLVNSSVENPEMIFGIDIDPIAVMLCKANLLVRYPNHVFIPKVYCFDYLAEASSLDSPEVGQLQNCKFDFIVTNPPWGAKRESGDSSRRDAFSLIMAKALSQLTGSGEMVFLLPEAFFNVKAHSWLRKQILEKHSLSNITLLPRLFSGVMTNSAIVHIQNAGQTESLRIAQGSSIAEIPSQRFSKSPNYVISLIDEQDNQIIEHVFARKHHTLGRSHWALGIVTGDNAGKLFSTYLAGREPIYTGKEITPYQLLPPTKFIVYDRSQFQQVAKDEYYRAAEKLVYKYITNRLVFAYDDKQRLFLNSANILIPDIYGMCLKNVALFLNSELFQFLYIKMFGEIKVLKGNLCQLPLPELSFAEDKNFLVIADDLISGRGRFNLADANQAVYDFYGLSDRDIERVRETVRKGRTG